MHAAVCAKTLDLPVCSAYGDVNLKDCLVLVGGSGFVEVAVNQGSAAKLFDVTVGARFCLSVNK